MYISVYCTLNRNIPAEVKPFIIGRGIKSTRNPEHKKYNMYMHVYT